LSDRRSAVFQPEFRDDLRWWVEQDRKMALRVFHLVEAVLRDRLAAASSGL
jgi:toxin YoeB